MKKAFTFPALMLFMGALLMTEAIIENKDPAAASEPVTVYQATFPVTVQSGEYELQSVILDFEPGAGVPLHMHGGQVLVVVLEGEITLMENNKERIMKAGESWTENLGNRHSVINNGKMKTRVAASFLLPKGAKATTVIKQ